MTYKQRKMRSKKRIVIETAVQEAKEISVAEKVPTTLQTLSCGDLLLRFNCTNVYVWCCAVRCCAVSATLHCCLVVSGVP